MKSYFLGIFAVLAAALGVGSSLYLNQLRLHAHAELEIARKNLAAQTSRADELEQKLKAAEGRLQTEQTAEKNKDQGRLNDLNAALQNERAHRVDLQQKRQGLLHGDAGESAQTLNRQISEAEHRLADLQNTLKSTRGAGQQLTQAEKETRQRGKAESAQEIANLKSAVAAKKGELTATRQQIADMKKQKLVHLRPTDFQNLQDLEKKQQSEITDLESQLQGARIKGEAFEKEVAAEAASNRAAVTSSEGDLKMEEARTKQDLENLRRQKQTAESANKSVGDQVRAVDQQIQTSEAKIKTLEDAIREFKN